MKGPGETGFGTLVYTDYGDGTSESSQFSHSFSSGSTSGEEYEITAYVYPVSDADDQTVDWDSYTLTVWTPPKEVITFPDTLTITDDIKIDDSYAFNVDVTSSSSNYVIDEIEVLVDGVSVVSQSLSGEASTSINIEGYISPSAGDTMMVQAVINGILKSGGKTVAVFVLNQMWRATLRTTLTGLCKCKEDKNPLDNKEGLPFTCWIENESGSGLIQQNNTTFNRTTVEWKYAKGFNLFVWGGRTDTNNVGRYTFANQVPIGYLIDVTLNSTDMHYHGANENNRPLRVCMYEKTIKAVDTGTVLIVVPIWWPGTIHEHFTVTPDEHHDPCALVNNNP